MNINKDSAWQDMTIGGTICDSANSLEYKTGDWRTRKPVFIPGKCNQC